MKRLHIILVMAGALVLSTGIHAVAQQQAGGPAEPEGILFKGRLNINTATAEEFAVLPAIDRLEAGNIVAYRTVNGPFSAIDDLLKVRGIRRMEYNRCKKYLTLEGETTLHVELPSLYTGQVNVNTAAPGQLRMLPAVNVFEADRIVAYRTANGPFRQIDDMLKVEGIRPVEFARIRGLLALEGETTLKIKSLRLFKGKININEATVDQLRMLPAVGILEAGTIVDYRLQNGPFSAVDDLLKVSGIRRMEYRRMEPFLSLTGETTLAPALGLR